jgi:hypothetical protein
MTGTNFDRLRSEVERSALWRSWLAVTQAYAAAWSESSVGRMWRTAADQTRHRPISARVRFAAIVIAWAAAWQVVILSMLPPYVLSGLPRVWFAALAAGAIVVALAAPALTSAWPASAIARLIARLNQKV